MLGFVTLSFVITIVLELPIIWLFTKKKICSLTGYIFIINLFTWPFANIAHDYLNLYAVETLVVMTESVLFMLLLKLKYSKALFVSFIANLVSAVIGYVLLSLSLTGIFSLSRIF